MKVKQRKRRVDTQRIRDDYGTVKRACRLKGVNYNTFKVWAAGFQESAVLGDKFREYLIEESA